MSHFTCMVIGKKPEDQLAPYSEQIEMPERATEQVSDEDMIRFYTHYIQEEQGTKEVNINMTPEAFEKMYDKKGKGWNGGMWKKHTDGTWWEYSTYNPQAKWDWYSLGGRWSGCYMKLKKGAKGTTGESGVFDNNVGIDAALKKDIDFEAIRKEVEDEATQRWDAVNTFLDENKVSREYTSWEKVREMFPNEMDKVRNWYHAQEIVKKFNEFNTKNDHNYAGFMGNGVTPYLVSKEEYVKRAGDGSFSTFAVVKDGQWYEKGEMGWWGIVSNKSDQDEWNQKVWELLQAIPEDTLISIYDCHI